ncbi:MAG: hypothetical protein ACYC65_02945 [Candidatus Limnocylindrales bacterium]
MPADALLTGEDVRFVAVFLLADRPLPTAQAAATAATAATLLAEGIPGFVPRPVGEAGSALLTTDRPSGAARTEPFLLEGAIERDGLAAGLIVGHLGAAALVVRELVTPGTFREMEDALELRLAGLIAEVASASRRLRERGLAAPWDAEGMRPGRLLWWHRLALTDRTPAEVHPNLRFGVPLIAAGDSIGTVAQGFSMLRAGERDGVDDCVRGLFAATEEWLLVDELTRRLGGWVLAVDGVDEALARTITDLRGATIDLIARRSMLEERARYLVNLAGAARIAARTAWGVDDEFRLMDERLVQMRHLVDDKRQVRQAVRDGHRNDLLFVFTLLAVLQTVLVVFDFATNQNEQIVSGVRIAVAFAVAGIGLALVARAAGETRRSDEGRRGRSRT